MKSIFITKQLLTKTISLIVMVMMLAPNAFAAKYYFSSNDNLVKGCSGTIEVKIDTEGANILAGDSTININSSEVSVNQMSIGTPLPMQVFNQVSDSQLKLSGARMPMTGAFNGLGILGYINFTPNETATSGTFSFSSDLNVENNLIDENITNALTDAENKTYTFKDRYNESVDGIGFCNPDNTPPNVQFVTPVPSSSNVPVNTNIILTTNDNRAGVKINSLKLVVDGVNYNKNKVTIQEEGGLYRIEANPNSDFAEGKNIHVSIDICDLNIPANCTTSSMTFRTYTPAPLPPVCGDGIANYQNGEQCDDGNTVSGDGCSSLCLYEIPVVTGTRNASCADGLHNQGEENIDCGGPCLTPCPTCVDGMINQDEESVDCGGPCPACGDMPSTGVCPVLTEPDNITICHYPSGNLDNPITMIIPETAWTAHQNKGDTLGACPVLDICAEALRFAAPEREERALEDIESIIEEKGMAEEQKSAIDTPTVITEVRSQIDICRANTEYSGANFSDSSADTDGDGMSDRMECYAETNPVLSDTDGDGCSDYEELNNYYTNPKDGTDCKVEVAEDVETFSDVFITDPQPGWILSTKQPVVSGKVPASTVLVLVVATQSEQARVNGSIKAIDAILNLSDSVSSGEITDVIAELASQKQDASDFLEEYGEDFNSDSMFVIIASIPDDLTEANIFSEDVKSDLEDLKSNLVLLKAKPIVATASSQLQNTTVGEFDAKNFEEASNPLKDKQIFDLVATAYLSDGSQVSSKAIRFSVDQANTISKPIPRTIGGKLITKDSTAFDNLFIGGKAYAQDEGDLAEDSKKTEVIIDTERPTITGETEFGSQVFAIWNSVVLASSVISDSEQGSFEVQAPRNLEVDAPHRVTLYAVKTEEGNKIRSESVDVYFKIKGPGVGIMPIVVTGFSILLLIILAFIIRRLLRRRSEMRLFK